LIPVHNKINVTLTPIIEICSNLSKVPIASLPGLAAENYFTLTPIIQNYFTLTPIISYLDAIVKTSIQAA
jgi:hypothetical protein